MSNKFVSFLMVSVLAIFSACGEKEQEITVQSIALSQPSAELIIGETLNLKATVSPSNATYDGITWTSTKTSVATVSGSGQVSALAEGNTTITAMAGGKTASCSITVVKGYVAVSSISLNKDSIDLVEGDTETLTATVSPNDATDKTVSWSSSNDAVATVKDGTITAIKEGEATISAKAGEKTASCKVVVAKKVILVEKVSLDKDELSLIVGESATLVATVEPDNATDKSVLWSSSDEAIASVNNSGVVTAKAAGEAMISAQAGDISAFCTIHISNDPKDEAIVFADNKLKACLVLAFDTNKDGELSYNEAASITSPEELKKSFREITTFTSFDEFKYFTGITNLASLMFEGWDQMTSITLPESLTGIGSSGAFGGCSSITSIVIPEGVTKITARSFSGCSNLSSVRIPDGVTLISVAAFYGCTSLTSISLPRNLERIYSSAFADCSNLVSISLPKSVSEIGEQAFHQCTHLSTVTLNEGLVYIYKAAFAGCESLTSISIPGSVTTIGERAFENCSELRTINLSDGISEIEAMAFIGTGINSITIPKSVLHIGNNPFTDTDLTSIIVEQGNPVYYSPNNTNAIIDVITNTLISGCKTTVIPDSVSRIGDYAFSGCLGLTSMIIPDGVTSIGSFSFMNCKNLSTVTLPKNLTGILEQLTFYGCSSLNNIVIPEGVTGIDRWAFNECTSLSDIVLPESLTTVGEHAISGCPNLKQLILPSSLTFIGDYAFAGDSGLTKIQVLASTPPRINTGYAMGNPFSATGSCPIQVPAASIEAYKQAAGWKDYASRIQAIQE